MTRLTKLKRVAEDAVSQLECYFPYYNFADVHDPRQFNAIYPQYEWDVEKPQNLDIGRQDWHHVFASDPSSGDRIEVFFERLSKGVAVTWARLKIDGRKFILPEQCYKDHSDVTTGVFSAGGVRLECDAPMRFWRIAINTMMVEAPGIGELNKDDSTTNESLMEIHVRFGCRLSAMSHPFEIPAHCPASKIARRYEGIDNVEEAKEAIKKCCSELQAYVQAVTLYIEVQLDGGDRIESLLFGSRLRCKGNSDFLEGTYFGTNCVLHHVGYAEDGTVFHVIESTDSKCFGFCFNPIDFDKAIEKGRIHRYKGQTPLQIAFTSGGTSHTIDLNRTETLSISRLNSRPGPLDSWLVKESHGELYKSKTCFRVEALTFKLRGEYGLPAEKLKMYSLLDGGSGRTSIQVVSTEDRECRSPELTGGKGSSLAVLASIAHYLNQANENNNEQKYESLLFKVPPAVILTVNAFKEFANLPEVKTAIEKLEFAVRNIPGQSNFKNVSEQCVLSLEKLRLPSSIEQQLSEKLTKVFGREWEIGRFAVRSSAVGEDSQEMSAAGQMASYLGVTGRNNLFESIIKCWASQFTLTALNYKRQYGQQFAAPMAVVVQKMVEPKCAGVMFTCDPVTAHPGRIVLTANFGLGESVASALADPDTYTFEYRSTRVTGKGDTKVLLQSKLCGTKEQMVVQSTNGTEEIALEIDLAQEYCLSDDEAIRIAYIGAKVMEFTDNPRDIEWAIVENEVVLLQSRPVTSFFRESDFETRHDLNSPLFTNREILTRANLDEVTPGAFTPLSFSVVNNLLFDSFARQWFEKIFPRCGDPTQYVYTRTLAIGKRFFMSFSSNVMGGSESFIETASVTMFGFNIKEHDAIKKGIFHKKKGEMSLPMIKAIWKTCSSIEENVKEAKEKLAPKKIDLPDEGDALSLLMGILTQMHKFQNGLIHLMATSWPSSLYNIIALNVLKKSQGEDEATPEMMALLSKLLRSDYEVESARIPEELSELSRKIRADPIGSQFPNMSCEESLNFLETDEGEAAKEFRRFRSKHAHRSYKEFDVHSKTWDIDPTPLIQTLQTNVRTDDIKRKDDTFLTIEDLKIRPSFAQRRILKFVLPRAKYAVYGREATKSVLMKCIHQIRLALRRLAKQLHIEGRLPDPELIFFFTLDELHRLITTRNPNLLPKAIRRARMHERLNKEKYPALFYGMPKPIDAEIVSIPNGANSLSGTPVSEGVVVGVVRIVRNFQTEAHFIQKGDILITRATDTGWTPYFPLLSGVVTEIGGLLSHGAVVAREYGLPAVVGVMGAIEFFQSGEIVTLDGNTGKVTKQEAGRDGRNEISQATGGIDLPVSSEDGTSKRMTLPKPTSPPANLSEVNGLRQDILSLRKRSSDTQSALGPLVRIPSETPL